MPELIEWGNEPITSSNCLTVTTYPRPKDPAVTLVMIGHYQLSGDSLNITKLVDRKAVQSHEQALAMAQRLAAERGIDEILHRDRT